MVRLVGVDLPRNKRIAYALTAIHGIGLTSARKIIEMAEISCEERTNDLTTEDKILLGEKRTNDLTTEDIILLREAIENPSLDLKLEGDLRRFNGLNIKRLSEINCYRGKRHRASLPARGQRTRTNARARRGSKKTVTNKKK